MKIVYSILGTFNSGGMERVLANKANYFARLGYEVTIVTTDQKGRKPYFALEPSIVCVDLGINYTDSLTKGLVGKLFSYSKKQHLHYKYLEKVLLRLQADIVVSMFDYDASFIYKIGDGSKKVLEIHFSRFKRIQYGRTGLWSWIDRYKSKQDLALVQKFDKFVVLTEEDKEFWGSLTNILVIPNANSFVSSEIASLQNKKVIAVGRLNHQKGFDDLIKSWSLVHKVAPDWTLNIFGDGPLKNYLNQMINDLGLNDVVFIKASTVKIIEAYLDHSILAMTSRYEGLPMVLLEAQVCGLPLVSYACKCGPRDIVTNDNGILVEEGDIESMAQSLLELIDNYDLRKQLGTNSKQNSVRFSEDIIMKDWITLFDDLINQK